MSKVFSRSAFAATLAAAIVAVVSVFPAAAQGRRGGDVVVFKDPNFRGAALSINGPIANLAYERFNDSISSIELRGTWELCVDPDFRGKCTVLNGSVAHLSEFRMNDNISSLRPVGARAANRDQRRDTSRRGRNNRGGDAISLFRDPGFRGAAVGFDGAIANLNLAGFNDAASSIRVNSGRWVVCEHPNFRGRCAVVDGSVSHLRNISLNDRITSLRRYDRRRDRDIGYGQNADYGYGNNRRDDDHLYGGPRDVGYGNNDDGRRSYQFDNPRDEYGRRLRARRGNAEAFCQANGYSSVEEVETSGDYIGCVVCSR